MVGQSESGSVHQICKRFALLTIYPCTARRIDAAYASIRAGAVESIAKVLPWCTAAVAAHGRA
jgi:hypothetical protein